MKSFLISVLFGGYLLLYMGSVQSAPSPIQPSKEWNKPEFSEYTVINKTQQWRYTKKLATLIVTKTECKSCTDVTQSDVNEYNKNENIAVLLLHNGKSAMLRFYASPKGVNFRVFQIFNNGFQYELQLGINNSATSQDSFKLEQSFYKLLNESKF